MEIERTRLTDVKPKLLEAAAATPPHGTIGHNALIHPYTHKIKLFLQPVTGTDFYLVPGSY